MTLGTARAKRQLGERTVRSGADVGKIEGADVKVVSLAFHTYHSANERKTIHRSTALSDKVEYIDIDADGERDSLRLGRIVGKGPLAELVDCVCKVAQEVLVLISALEPA
jgi:hypothetical protein